MPASCERFREEYILGPVIAHRWHWRRSLLQAQFSHSEVARHDADTVLEVHKACVL